MPHRVAVSNSSALLCSEDHRPPLLQPRVTHLETLCATPAPFRGVDGTQLAASGLIRPRSWNAGLPGAVWTPTPKHEALPAKLAELAHAASHVPSRLFFPAL